MTEDILADDGPEVVYVDDGMVVGDEMVEARDESSGGRGRVVDEPDPVTDELLDRAKAAGIKNEEISKGGGWRANEFREIYWLDLGQLCEFEEADQQIKDDKEFWAWFRKFRFDEGLGGKKKKGWASWKEQAGGWWDQQKKTNYLNKWWSDFGYSGSSKDGETAKNLAIALKAVNTTVGIVNTTGSRYVVEFADDSRDQQTSYTDFDNRKVVISPQPLLDNELVQDDAIEIETGYGLHEASHIKYTEPIRDALLKPTKLEPLAFSHRLFNILEDERIEGLTGEMFPGFAPYFEKMLAYLWKRTKEHVPTTWGPELIDKLNAILGSVRWPEEFGKIAAQDPDLQREFDWTRAWRDRYLNGTTEPRQAMVEMLMHLKEDPETADQLKQEAEAEKQSMDNNWGEPNGLSDEQFGKMMKALEEQLSKGKGIDTCPSPQRRGGKEIRLTPEQSEQMKKLVNWELDVKDPVVTMRDMYGGNGGPQISWLKPDLTDYAKDAYRKPDDLVAKMKSAFFFRKAAPEWSERLLKNGAIDEEEIWRFGAQDYRIFEQKKHADVPETQVTLLVDMSGSMTGERIKTAYELANTMLACLSTMKGVRVKMRGHTTRTDTDRRESGGEATIYRLWEQGDQIERLGLIDTLPHGWNYDGFAIGAICEEMLADARPREDSVVFVLSDGKPNARGFQYSGTPAMDHVREVVSHYKRLGVTIVQIAIDPEMRTQDQERMYEHWIPFTKREELPAQLTRKLIQLFSTGG